MTHKELCDLLTENGFEDGWCLAGDTLTLWFHEQDPPAPLTRPTELEAPTTPE
jgi:hypothetical protein